MAEAALIRARISNGFASIEFALFRATRLVRRRDQARRRAQHGPIMRLCGTAVAPGDARTLVDLLLRHGTTDAIGAATVIEQGIRRQVFSVMLNPRERETALSVLGDAPDGLIKLRGVLAEDQRDRMG